MRMSKLSINQGYTQRVTLSTPRRYDMGLHLRKGGLLRNKYSITWSNARRSIRAYDIFSIMSIYKYIFVALCAVLAINTITNV